LHGLDHLCIVQVSVAEVEANQGVAHELTFPHGARVDVGQGVNSSKNNPRPSGTGLPVVARLGDDVAETRDWMATVLGDLGIDNENGGRTGFSAFV